ncbi:hypothetical protein IAU60_005041 [Kwoniella sp. DSM 27419]
MSAPASSSARPHGALRDYMRPPQHIGMQTLDRSAFEVSVPILSLAVEAAKIGKLRPHPAIKDITLELPKVKPIIDSPEGEKGVKYIRLHLSEGSEIPEEARKLIDMETKGLRREQIMLGYDNWNTAEILNAVLPTEKSDDIPSSFTSTGHIAHMNLRDEWLPYRHLVGQVILDKNPGLRTVVNKLDTIHAQYRYFDMEVIAGEQDYITTLNESDCSFTFDFSRVYWNSRLHHEHERLIGIFPPGSLVADVMAGVGPFAVPAARRGSYVLGNDLNPESVKWMRENRIKNHVEDNLRVSELDGAAFIQNVAVEAWEKPFTATMSRTEQRRRAKQARKDREKLKASAEGTDLAAGLDSLKMSEEPQLPEPPRVLQHFIMNLPDSALTFLGAYIGCFTPLLSIPSFVDKYGTKGEGVDMPMVHVYCFTREIETEKAEPDILQRASQYLEYPVTTEIDSYNLHLVRSVAPNKDMYCLSFRLPRQVAFKHTT